MKLKDLVKFQPTWNLLPMLVAWLFVVASLYLAFQVFTTEAVALNFLFFGVAGILIGGVGIPVYVTCVLRRRPVSDLGVTTRSIGISLGIGLVLSAIQYRLTLANETLPGFRVMVPLVAMTLVVTLYEAVFYRGFIQQGLEECFGILPSVLLGAGIYTLYHIGYGMTAGELPPLYLVGLTYALIFRLTRNIFVLWPFLSPLGALHTHVRNGLRLPFAATWGFLDVFLAMVGIMVWAIRKGKVKMSIAKK